MTLLKPNGTVAELKRLVDKANAQVIEAMGMKL